MILLPSFYAHIYFIEGNERFKLGGEDLEKTQNFQFFKIFQIFTILKLLFFKFLPLLIPYKF